MTSAMVAPANILAARGTQAAVSATRREIRVGGRRIRTVDVHAHCVVPEVLEVLQGSSLASAFKGQASGPLALGPARLRAMDEQGVDVEALSINAFWYSADRELARQIVKVQNEKLSEW